MNCKHCYFRSDCGFYNNLIKNIQCFFGLIGFEEFLQKNLQEKANNCEHFLNDNTLYPLMRTNRYQYTMSLDEIIKKLIIEAEIEEEE